MKPNKNWLFSVILILTISMFNTSFMLQDYERIEIEIASDGITMGDTPSSGTVLLWITNADLVEHNVMIQGPGLERTFLSPIQPGQTKTMRVEFFSGDYTINVPDGSLQAQFSISGGAADGDEAENPPAAQQSGQNGDQQTTPTGQAQQDQQSTPTQQEGNGQQGGDGEQLIQQGEQVFESNCASCHGQNGQGQVGPALSGNEFVTQQDPSDVIDTVLHGRSQMPAFEDQLSDEEIAAVISFIRNSWDNSASNVSPDQIGQGTGGEQQGQQTTQTPGGDNQADQQMTPTPTQENQQSGDEGVPVTGEQQAPGYSVAQVAQPGQSGSLDVQVDLVKIAEGFTDPINVVAAPDDSGRLFVVERNGIVRIVQDGQVVEEPFLDISENTLDTFLEQGLYDLEFHPDFAENGRFYVHFAEVLRNGDSMIVEYTVSSDNPDQADPQSARQIMQIDQPYANHNGGELAFGPDGYLYIGSGDGGWEGDPLEAGQDLSTLLGKVLRIDVNQGNGFDNYSIPADNPFASKQALVQLFDITEEEFAEIHTEARPEIWAWGLRNPWKFQFDPQTGDLYLPDVGQNHWEEINFQPADSTGGENYGWDYLMGSHCFPVEAESCQPFGVLPVAEYSHALGNAVVGIGVYRGEQYASMDGIYFVSDWGSGRVWGLQRSNDEEWTFAELIDSDLHITGAGQDADGNLYVTSCNCAYGGPPPTENPPGALWMIVPKGEGPEGAEIAPAGEQPDQQDQQDDQSQATPTPGNGQSGQEQATPTPEDSGDGE